ncbi:hypothetical protein [Terriglobus sp.]|uniref:hypothetical protein n=1 Tax=Terriglobus sp. TaxID=1889013 RepID=UPI003B000B69
MPEERRFIAGETFNETFRTMHGWLVFSAFVEILGDELHLLNVGIEPLHEPYLKVGYAAVLALRRQIYSFAQAEGYAKIVLKAWRRGGANPRRLLSIRGRTR